MERQVRNTTIKVRLDPTPEQAERFEKTFGCCRYLWNQMLADEERFYSETGAHFLPTPAKYKKDAPFLKEVDSGALVTVHQDLRKAFQHFFDDPVNYRHPVYKRKKSCKNSYTIYCKYYSAGNGSNLYLTESGIRLPKMGVVRARLYRKPLHWWTLKTATISRTPSGKYFCSLMFEYPVKEPKAVLPTQETTLGLNFSLSHFYTDSNGYQANPPRWLAKSSQKLKRLQQKISRSQPGSRNREELLQKLRLLHEHIANQRKDFIHKESRRIANAWDAVCVKDTDLTEMARALPLGNVPEVGFGMFRTCLRYKLERLGKQYILVDKYFPSAKTCHNCGSVNDSLEPFVQSWTCPSCGARHDRGRNGAENLRDQGLKQFYGEQKWRIPA